MEELMEILEELRPDVDFAAEENFNSAEAMLALIEKLQEEE